MTEDEKREALFRKKRRLVSGAIVEEGRAPPTMRGGAGNRDTASSYDSLLREKEGVSTTEATRSRFWRIIGGIFLAILIIVIAVAVTVSKNKAAAADDKGGDDLATVNKDSIPTAARGTYLDPFTWYDTKDLNVTYTNATVGDLPIMGLFSEWDDSARANDKVPPLDKPWGDYTKTPARGVNVGGWLSLEPFITPSLFAYDRKLGIIDEYTLMKHLGPKTAASTLEKHYATFVTEQTFADIQAAGLDHVRIPYSYWAVEVYDDDPYVFRISWRYLLRAIEYCRKYGLRVNLDLHGIPGSQNGWNHSGRWGQVRWLNGTDGTLNRQRSLDVHDRLSKFFAQDRYKNIIAFYGLANEPRMVDLPAAAVTSWTTDAYNLVRGNGISANVVFGDGFMGLENWQGKLTGMNKLVLDVHQYVIFNKDQIVYTHQKKVEYACDGWTQQAQLSMDTSTGYGPTMFAEWSQADTDCALHLTNVGWGNRWTGTYASGDANAALTPRCPAQDSSCSCDEANKPDAGSFSASYKQFLKMFAEAQMHSFEKGWGWWYWTWDTESAPLWSYKKGLAAGILPAKAYDRDFNCDADVPDFGKMGLSEDYRREVGVSGAELEDAELVVDTRVDAVLENRMTLEELIVGV
ncbi:glycoside hydrolase superfamily [Microdochium trichocladiopsis]|uniref:glucan 1,3-beta-glucosidase n=1 Tax=Microdochium trichocladiopsis TaxID=1682393 RepID=A0A9P8Y3A4_9PEZI|nr:glycoside hydrolase superfamily [Microdochium trichocladiopsis]KAH7028069.1 glycoside hydrolase superfamily [Microdochium trichocladiopsis]